MKGNIGIERDELLTLMEEIMPQTETKIENKFEKLEFQKLLRSKT